MGITGLGKPNNCNPPLYCVANNTGVPSPVLLYFVQLLKAWLTVLFWLIKLRRGKAPSQSELSNQFRFVVGPTLFGGNEEGPRDPAWYNPPPLQPAPLPPPPPEPPPPVPVPPPRPPAPEPEIPEPEPRRGHRFSGICLAAQDRRRQRRAILRAQEAAEVKLTATGDELEVVHTFRYLGRPLSTTDNDWPALYRNMAKARQRWSTISRVLVREGATPAVSGMFYKAVVQSTLLFGSETWVITPSMWTALNGFHHRMARSLAGGRPRLERGEWVYPPIEPVLREAGLFTMEEYVLRRRRTLAPYISDRPILQHCRDAARLSGTPTRTTFWWEQPEVVVNT